MKVKILAMAALAATVMTSCKNSEEEVANNDRVAVKFSANLANVQTRVDGSDWTTGDPIGIYMIKGTTLSSGSIAESVDNYEYTAKAATNTSEFQPASASTTIYYPQDGSSVEFTAYHPYLSSVTGFSLPIDLSDQTAQTKIDVMYAGVTNGSYSKNPVQTVTLTFEHKLSKLVFEIDKDASVPESLDNLEVEITGQQTSNSMDLTTGNITPTAGTSSIKAKTAANGKSSEAIVFPSTISGMTFTFKTSEHTYVGNIPNNDWENGKKYTYTVKLQKNEVVIEGTIKDWTPVSGGNVTAD